MSQSIAASGPMPHLDDWEESLSARYPSPEQSVLKDSSKAAEQFRDYAADVRPSVREFYRLNHRHQTLDFVLEKKRSICLCERGRWGSGKRWSSSTRLLTTAIPTPI